MYIYICIYIYISLMADLAASDPSSPACTRELAQDFLAHLGFEKAQKMLLALKQNR